MHKITHPSIHPFRRDQVANDAQGRSILNELQSDGIDTSYILVRITSPQRFSDNHSVLSSRMQCILPFFSGVRAREFTLHLHIIVDEQTWVHLTRSLSCELWTFPTFHPGTGMPFYLAQLSYWIIFEHPLLTFRKTRTCIHTPGSPPMVPEELTKANLSSALDGADIVYFDVRLHDTALLVAEEVISSRHNPS